MKSMDSDCKRLCEIQANLFEQSVSKLDMSSAIFVRRFMNSSVARELDSKAFLDDTKTINDVFNDLDKEYGKTTYGSFKYHKDVMYWVGYLYRCFSYVYELSSSQAYKMLPFNDVATSFNPYHTLDILQAIERLLEEKNISFNENELLKKGVSMLKEIRHKYNIN